MLLLQKLQWHAYHLPSSRFNLCISRFEFNDPDYIYSQKLLQLVIRYNSYFMLILLYTPTKATLLIFHQKNNAIVSPAHNCIEMFLGN